MAQLINSSAIAIELFSFLYCPTIILIVSSVEGDHWKPEATDWQPGCSFLDNSHTDCNHDNDADCGHRHSGNGGDRSLPRPNLPGLPGLAMLARTTGGDEPRLGWLHVVIILGEEFNSVLSARFKTRYGPADVACQSGIKVELFLPTLLSVHAILLLFTTHNHLVAG